MRDITKDLEERIEEAKKERARLQRQISELDKKAETLTATLESERTLWPEQPALPGMVGSNGASQSSSTFSRFIQQALSDGRPRSLDELKLLAQSQGIDFGGKAPGRVLHYALVAMQQNKIVERTPSGEWQIWKNGGHQGRA